MSTLGSGHSNPKLALGAGPIQMCHTKSKASPPAAAPAAAAVAQVSAGTLKGRLARALAAITALKKASWRRASLLYHTIVVDLAVG